MNTKILTIALALIVTLGGTTGIYAATNSKPALAADTADSTAQTTTAETTAAAEATPTSAPVVIVDTEPTIAPTAAPTAVPTAEPTTAPTVVPTADPTAVPTVVPTTEPADKDEDTKTPIDPASVLINEENAKAIATTFAGTTSEIVKVELEDENGVILYEIKLMTDVSMIEVKIDANTGVIISSEIKDCKGDDILGDHNDSCKDNETRKNCEAFLDNKARKSGDASWDGETRKNDMAFADNAARKGDASDNKSSKDKSDSKTENVSHK